MLRPGIFLLINDVLKIPYLSRYATPGSIRRLFIVMLTVSRIKVLIGLGVLCAALIFVAWYASYLNGEQAGDHQAATTFLWIAILLLVAKLSGFVGRFGQPVVLGELVAGVVLGNVALLGLTVFEPIKHDAIVNFLAELGVVILLFQIGLESNIAKMRAVGLCAFLVATIGVVAPFILGTYLVGPWLLPGLSTNAYLFLGAALTATSVGVTARVFRDLGKLQIPEAHIVLGAAVIDDVMGLIILAVLSAIVTLGSVSAGAISWIAAKSVLFLIGAIVAGQLSAPWLGRLLLRVHSGGGRKLTLAMSFGLMLAWLASVVGLAPIVGAFAAGLLLDPVHFRRFRESAVVQDMRASVADADAGTKQKVEAVLGHHTERHIDALIEPIAHLFVPLFFVITGMAVNLETFLNPHILLAALGITAVAFIGKILSGLVAGGVNKWIVGIGMIPRGEVGLIFASIGKSLGVISEEVFSVIIIMVMMTTLVTPMLLTWLLKRQPVPSNGLATATTTS